MEELLVLVLVLEFEVITGIDIFNLLLELFNVDEWDCWKVNIYGLFCIYPSIIVGIVLVFDNVNKCILLIDVVVFLEFFDKSASSSYTFTIESY